MLHGGSCMPVFYILPPRSLVSLRLGRFLQSLLPGTEWKRQSLDELVESLGQLMGSESPAYVVHRDDLPAGPALLESLREGYGAESGDEVVEVRLGSQPEEMISQRWLVP